MGPQVPGLPSRAPGAFLLAAWDLPGGAIEFGESPLDALAREFREETGLTFTEARLLDAVSTRFSHMLADDTEEDLHHIGIIYAITLESIAELKLNADGQDSLGCTVVPLNRATTLNLSPFARFAVEKFLS